MWSHREKKSEEDCQGNPYKENEADRSIEEMRAKNWTNHNWNNKKNASQKIEQTTIEIIEETASNQIEQIASKQKETAINKIAYITHSKAYFYILPKILTTLLGKPPLGIWWQNNRLRYHWKLKVEGLKISQ